MKHSSPMKTGGSARSRSRSLLARGRHARPRPDRERRLRGASVAAIVLAVTLLVNWINLSPGLLPAKYLTPGLIFLGIFQACTRSTSPSQTTATVTTPRRTTRSRRSCCWWGSS